MTEQTAGLKEAIIRAADVEAVPGGTGRANIFTFVSAACGATTFSTGIARFNSGTILPYHTHECSEAVTVLEGEARITVEGREYLLRERDCIHIPKRVAHQVESSHPDQPMTAHWSFATASPDRTLVENNYQIEEHGYEDAEASDPETTVRYATPRVYELAPNALFVDLFARRFGADGICGGHGRFMSGASLPCHTHDFDESITIVKGRATCLVQGRRYELKDCDTAFIPRGLPHRFLNHSSEEMAMIWVYAGSEPDRQIVDAGYCWGELQWPGGAQAKA